MNARAIEKTEFNKILAQAAAYATLDGGKERLASMQPGTTLSLVKQQLKETEECVALLFSHGISKIEYYQPFGDELERAKKGSALSCGELLKTCNLLRAARIAYTSIQNVNDEQIVQIKKIADNIYYHAALEDDIQTKILSETEVSDHASEKLYALRREIRLLNERIRGRLGEYLSGGESKYLQDSIITMRDNRYVLPVRAEYKRNVKGFIHDRSATGATFFIEPEEILEMNNELRTLTMEEKAEVERILLALSNQVGSMADQLTRDMHILEELDAIYARAEYAYKTSSVYPEMNDQGAISIEMGRHPLIDRKKVVPVSLALGKDYRFLLLSGPNTGGKTVTLKMVGLFCMMAMCGFFVPARRATLSTFEEIYCDIGDAQSIEESLSTFSSHITNIIHIINRANAKSLVLIDELGGGTDPDEGQALAKAIVGHLLQSGATGVVTTHYTSLKEFAFATKGIENACMEFDSNTLQPLYVIRIGIPGASNALAISRRLGLKEDILQAALANLSEDAQKFENIIRSAEESRIQATAALQEANALKSEWQSRLSALEIEKDKLQKEKDKVFSQAKAESRRIIHERTAAAEELLEEIENIFAQESISEADLIKARTLKNRLLDQGYETEQDEALQAKYVAINENNLAVGQTVYVKSVNQQGTIQSVRAQKKEAEVLCGSIRIRCKFSDLLMVTLPQVAQSNYNRKTRKVTPKKESVQVVKSLQAKPAPTLELNVIGLTVHEALPEVDAFLDAAVLANLEEVRIIHGVGTGKLRAGIHERLRGHKNVAEYRLGRYGEGETGVTIVKIK